MPAHAPEPEEVAGRYLLYGMLASGGMATVHLGRLIGPAGFSRTVAIKRLHDQFASDPQFVSGLLDEARLTARIRHPNVVPTLDVVATGEQVLLVLEYVQGESLSRLLASSNERGERVPLPIVVSIIAGVLHGLQAAHEATSDKGEPLHIVHRDVSPQNVMVGVDGVARVLDFGVAKAVGRLQDKTREGQLKGKIAYMAPEQVCDEPIDSRTDVFEASIVLWEMLTSKRLFAGETEASTLANLLQRDIQPPSQYTTDIPAGLDAVVMRGLSRDPKGRYPTARQMAIALEDLVAPATAVQVGTWVSRLAGDALRVRAKSVAEIESASSELSKPRQSLADAVATRLTRYLGPHTSKVAVRTFSLRALGRAPETLTADDLPALQAALRPMLRTFLGRTQCERVLYEIARELST